MAFNDAHDFYIHQLNAVDGQSKGDKELMRLLDAACLGAGHRSAERGDAPKCHPDTRKAVLKDIMSWVDSPDPKEPLMWLSGPAGAGKTSIAQTVCDQCDDEQKLLASFFFSRSAVGSRRDDGKTLAPTLAVQLLTVIPETKGHIIEKLEKDPLLLTYSMEKQMKQLVLEPLTTTLSTLSSNAKTPYLIVIDGLDECYSRSRQAKIIKAFAAISSKANFRFRCLIASRPELEIRNTFNLATTSETCVRIVLDQHYEADDDIRVYLQSEFSSLKRKHTLMSHLSQDSKWPTSKDIDWLVKKSSGQFIYASTIMKYLGDPRRNPKASLRAIINHKINKKKTDRKSLYSPLDELYKFVLESASLNLRVQERWLIPAIFQVLLFPIKHLTYFQESALRSPQERIKWTLPHLATFLSITISELELLLSDLHSVLFVPGRDSEDRIRLYHASLSDFLRNPSRSSQFYVSSEKGVHKALAKLCFNKLCNFRSRVDDGVEAVVLQHRRECYFQHIRQCGHFRSLEVYCSFLLDYLMKPGVR